MTTANHNGSTTGPITNLAAAYCGQLDAVLQAGEPAMRAVGRYNLELARLAAQRTRAWIALPAQVSHCKSPDDLAALQLQFWQAATLNYLEGMQRMWSAAGSIAPGQGAREGNGNAHDFLDVREPAAPDTKPRSSRQAA